MMIKPIAERFSAARLVDWTVEMPIAACGTQIVGGRPGAERRDAVPKAVQFFAPRQVFKEYAQERCGRKLSAHWAGV